MNNSFDEAISLITNGNCILILGSGFSHEAKNSLGKKLPLAQELSEVLDELSGEDSDGLLGLSADNVIEQKGVTTLIQKLKEELTPTILSDSQKTIAQLPWRRVYTTNYDDIIEHGARLKGRRVDGVVLSDNPSDWKDKTNLVIHINGLLSRLSSNSLNDEFKLCDSSYITSTFAKSPWWHDVFIYDLKDCDAVFFVGISLKYDLDIRRLVASCDINYKSFFIMAEDERKSSQKMASAFGEVHPIGVAAFGKMLVPQLSKRITNTIIVEEKYHAFDLINNVNRGPVIDDEKIRKLLIWGHWDTACIQYSVRDTIGYPYIIYRDELDKAVNIIDNGGRNIVIHGNVGNGKSIFVRSLAHILTHRGYNVFVLSDNYDGNVRRELESICSKADKRSVIIIESYNSHKELLGLFKAFRGDAQLVVTERTSLNDIHFDSIKEIIGEEFSEIGLNRLSAKEINSLINLLDHVNLWGTLAASREWEKRQFIERECGKELRSVLLHLLETKPILDHLRSLVDNVENNGGFYKSLIMILLSTYADFHADIYDIASAVDQDLLNNASFTRHETIREFIDFSTGKSKATSPILAEVMLKRLINANTLISTLEDIFKSLDNNHCKYGNVLRKLMTYSTVHTILEPHLGNKANRKIANFYDRIKGCKVCVRNPHFWLQYAITMLEIGDFPAAAIYFDNAYSYAKNKQNFSRVQIDNHFARYLLSNAIENEDSNFMESFQTAHGLLLNPTFMKETKYYPFKVAKLYQPFFTKYQPQMNPVEISLFKEKVNDMLQHLDIYLNTKEGKECRFDVAESRKSLQSLLSTTTKFKS